MFLTCLILQLIFIFIVFGRFAFFHTEKPNSNVQKSPVSILICARNEVKNLQKFLPLWLEQDYENFEVIVVNDRSTDETQEILAQFSEKYPHLRPIHLKNKPENYNGKKYAIEQGIKSAQHDLILLTDADCYPKTSKNIQSRVAQFDQNTEFVIGYSPYEFSNTLLNYIIQYETLYTAIQYLSFTFLGHPYMAVGRNLAYRRQLFLTKNGFHKYSHLTGGDDDLFVNQYATAQNTNLVIHVDSQVISIPEKNWLSWFQQKKRHLSAGQHYRLKDKVLLGLLSFSQIGFWFFLIKSLLFWENEEFILILVGFIIRQAGIFFVFWRFIQILQSKLPVGLVFVLEFLYLLYYISTGFISLISKKIAWKEKKTDNFQIKH